ncbi:MAG: TIGR04086 family membrane protein [Clostridia bacterium]|nr:TIGR04086 family membrane protein [Clostridia bacterium]
MENIKENEFSKNILRIVNGSITAIILTLILLLVFAMILTYTDIKENTINPVIIVITGISILVGSSVSTLKIKKNGLINGFLVGLIYIITIYLISSITRTGFKLNFYSIIMMSVSTIMGMIGGIIGVNLK